MVARSKKLGSRKPAGAGTGTKLMATVKAHPIGTAAIVGGVVAGAVLIGKAANTAAKVVTIKVAADAAAEVARAVRGPAKRKITLFGGNGRAGKSATKRKT